MSKNEKRLTLLVGHCMPDSFGLTRLVKRSAPGTKVERVNSDRALSKRLESASLLLVNRQLDGRFAASLGVDLIGSLRAAGATAAMMVVSNYAEAQEAAVAAGAARGFGKQDMHDPSVAERLSRAMTSSAVIDA